jgi:iron complex outermembrane recepter protein
MLKPTSRRHIATATALAVVGLAAGLPQMVLAQESLLEEIVVTAQKREQSLQDVSMSLSAFSGNVLEQRAIEDIADLQYSVPNVISDGFRVTIRGVGNNAIASSAEGGLGYHINGVYVNRPLMVGQEYFDLERVEVLRGPQGTLYGRNTTAGVINVLTRKPGEEFGGDVAVTLGNYNSINTKGAINIPITDNIRQRFAANYSKRDGYTENVYNGHDIDGRDSYEIRSSTAFEFGENTSMDLVISYFEEDSNRSREVKGTCTKDATYGCSPLSAGFETPDVTNSLYQTLNNAFLGGALLPQGDFFAGNNNPRDYRKANADQDPTWEAEQLGVSVEIKHELDNYSLTSLTGYYDTTTDTFADFDRFAPDVKMNFPVTYRANTKDYITTDEIKSGRRNLNDSQQFTQEFRISSNYEGSFNFLLGAFYYDEESAGQALFTHPTFAFIQQALGMDEAYEMYNIESDPIETTSMAIFGEGYFDLTDKTRLTVGLRYTDDEKSIKTRQQFLPPYIVASDDWILADADWQETTGKLTLEHFISDDSMVFATIARGYKAGGMNPGGQGDSDVFDPEYINQFEVGSKNTFMDGRLRANFGAFLYDYEGLQIGQVAETSAVTVNGDATVMGAEGEFVFVASDAMEFDLTVSWLDMELNDFTSADTSDPDGIAPGSRPALDSDGNSRYTGSGDLIQDLDGNTLRNAPELSLKVGAQYSAEVFDGYQLTGRVDHFWQDEYMANEFNKPSDAIDSWSQTDLQLVLEPNSSSWLLRAYMKNAFDNDDVTRRGQDGPSVGRFRSIGVLEPRTYGVELRKFFQ